MEKILISWEGYKEDFENTSSRNEFKRERKVLKTGPTFSLHKDFPFEYQKHILLSAPENEEDTVFSNILIDELKKSFPDHPVESHKVKLKDPLDIVELFNITNKLLLKHQHCDIEVFISTGYPNTRVAWFLVQPNFKQNLKLFQIRQAKFSTSGKPEKIYVNLDTFNLNAISIYNDFSKSGKDSEIFIPKTLDKVYEKAQLVAATNDISCLILGENGTGKENLARFIHNNSERKDKPFVAVNCASYSDELLRSELFGYEKGSFTGADKLTKGVFEESNGGTIFLDEIGDISAKMQVSLLRALQEKKIQRVGGTKDISIDTRVIAATNKEIEEMCNEEKFRWDLFFRLATTTIRLPSLRDWKRNEIKSLLDYLNDKFLNEFKNKTQKLQFSEEALKIILNHNYLGNIRELQNLVLSLYTFTKNVVKPDDLPDRMLKKQNHPNSLEENERIHIKTILEKNNWNKKISAEALGITRETLYRKMEKYNLDNKKI